MTLKNGPRPFAIKTKPIDKSTLGLIEDGCVIFDSETGKILFAGETSALKSEISQCDTKIQLSNQMVTPGFVDCHSHPGFTELRLAEFDLRNSGATYQEIALSGGGIKNSVDALRKCQNLVAKVEKNIHQMVKCGTTALEAKSGYGLSIESELAQLIAFETISSRKDLLISPTLLAAHSCCPSFGGDIDAYFEQVVLPALILANESSLIDSADIFVEEGYFSPEHANQLANLCSKLQSNRTQRQINLRLHIDQFSDGGGAELSTTLGAQSADHLEFTGTNGIECLRSGATFPVCLPASVLCLGKLKYPAASDMFDNGLPVCIATDYNPGSSSCPNMATIMHISATMMHLSAAECWVASIWNPAHNIQNENQIGSIEASKRADLLIWNTTDYQEPVVHLGANLIQEVWVNGNCVVKS